MKILLDTNVVLDVLLDRMPFKKDSYGAMRKALEEGHQLFISASAATDIFYVLSKALGSKRDALINMKTFMKIVSFAKVDEDDIINALTSGIADFEDAVVDSVAVSLKANLILTRNAKDLRYANVAVMTPADYLSCK